MESSWRNMFHVIHEKNTFYEKRSVYRVMQSILQPTDTDISISGLFANPNNISGINF